MLRSLEIVHFIVRNLASSRANLTGWAPVVNGRSTDVLHCFVLDVVVVVIRMPVSVPPGGRQIARPINSVWRTCTYMHIYGEKIFLYTQSVTHVCVRHMCACQRASHLCVFASCYIYTYFAVLQVRVRLHIHIKRANEIISDTV